MGLQSHCDAGADHSNKRPDLQVVSSTPRAAAAPRGQPDPFSVARELVDMNRIYKNPQAAIALAVLLLSAGCGEWPDLASVPEAAPLAPRSPVRLPPAMRSAAPLDAEAAEQALEVLPGRLERLEMRISGQQVRYLEAFGAAAAEAGEAPGPLDSTITRRSAEFELSRLSALETDLSVLLEDFERLRLSPLTPEAKKEAARLRRAAEDLTQELSSFLSRERRRLSRLSERG